MRLITIVNPYVKGRKRKAIESAMMKKLSHSLVSIEFTKTPEESTEVAKTAAGEGLDGVVAVGGDGTVNSVLNGLVGSNTALGIIPAGTANDLASYHTIPNDIERAFEITTQNHYVHIDLICVNGRYYATDGGVGVPCEIARRANEFKQYSRFGRFASKLFGSQLYVLATLSVLFSEARRAARLTIRSNGGVFTINSMFLMVNNQHTVGKNFVLSPGARNDDGVFDVCLVEHIADLRGLLQLLGRSVRGTHTQLPCVKTWRERAIRVHAEEPVPYLADGEILHETTDFSIALHARALKLLTPFQSSMINSMRIQG